ncbi:hypothetical protein QM012_000099 [Aureobasidium pullulans]|uniref:Gfd2/YDR514C-like C-terminal domain-containing protein n=1 Tax=Aureobasidium pullulans TaxID=5580 RepID=A0ABR0TWB0_AURPU
MNAQKETELLAMQHIFGLKDASDEAVKIKPKELETLQRLKAAEPVFVCIDLEAFEFAHEKITEVGVSVLDSRHVVGTDPGPDGNEWLSKISTRHILIKEHKHLVNKRFLHGCPDKFNFGDSEVVSLKNIHKTLTQLFDNPSPNSIQTSGPGSRKLILVGHGLSNDTAFLKKLNFAPHATGNIIRDVDTARFVGTKKQMVGLSKLLIGLGVDPENLHNAGNDAAYTMQALLLMTIQHTNDPGAYVKAVADAKAKVDPAKQRYKEHRAAINAKKLAQQKERATKVALQQISKLGQHTDEPMPAPPAAHNRGVTTSETLSQANPMETQRQFKPNAGSRTRQGSTEPVSTVSELNKSIFSGDTLLDESPAQRRSAKNSSEESKGTTTPRHRRRSSPSGHFAHPHSSSSDHADVGYSSRKRKSSDVESVGDDVRLLIDGRLHKGQSDKTAANSGTPSGAGPSLRGIKDASDVPKGQNISARNRAPAPFQAAKNRTDNNQHSSASGTPWQTDTSRIRKVDIGKTEMPPHLLRAAEGIQASQQPAHTRVRKIASGKVKDDSLQASLRAAGAHQANLEAERSHATSDAEQPRAITKETHGVLRKWLDGG